ncbi:BCCT family transporter, partial [Klebsiella pneumoniae]|nr:BCCT family transporter [Klebsiella pneumoniae]
MSTETAHDAEPEKGQSAGSAEQLRPKRPKTDRVVFGATALIMFALVIWGIAGTESLSTTSSEMLDWLLANTGWGFILAATGFVIFGLYLAFSKYGKIPLGADDEEPEFRTSSWIAMMFSAGMGIGLMFYGVSEPLSHFVSPPPGSTPGESDEALRTAMA